MARAPALTLVHALLWRAGPQDETLKHVLAAALRVAPGALRIARDARGKPFIAAPKTDLHFSLSHAGAFQLLAWAHGAPVGADLETAGGAVSDLYFTQAERALGEPLRLWTAKEALAKATGLGMPDMARFEVRLAPPRVIAGDAPDAWRLWTLTPQRDLVAAVAIRTPHAALVWNPRVSGV